MAGKIYETLDYEKFDLHEVNRRTDSTKSRKRIGVIKKLMTKYGFQDGYPLFCVKNGGGKLRIKAGHHRFKAAQSLGIAVKFVLGKDDISIYEIESSTGIWDSSDFHYSYVKRGFDQYILVDKFKKRTGIPLGACIGLLGGGIASSSNKGKAYKAGTYVVKNTEHANAVGDMVVYLRSIGISWAANSLLVNALSKVFFVPQLDLITLRKKFKSNKAYIQKQITVSSYLTMIEDIYNNRNRKNKLPLAFLADQAARERKEKLFSK